MADAVRWYLALQVLALLALPICGLAFRALPDRGYALSKAFGWAFAGWLAWMAAAAGLPGSGATTAQLALLAVALCSGPSLLLHRGGYLRAWGVYFWERKGYVLALEATFALAFGAMALLRAHVPDAAGTEKPMEFMLLQTAYLSPDAPPPDLWLSGYPVNYYYFGYHLNAFVGLLSGVGPDVGFNLALAGTWAVALVALAGVGYNAAVLATGGRVARLLGAALAPLLVLLVGNPAGTLGWWESRTTGESFDWWAPSRVVYDAIPGRGDRIETINEFPAFSCLLGDLHPHVLAMPLFALGIGASLALALSVTRPRTHLVAAAVLSAAVAGWVYMTNSWDVPAVVAVALVAPALAAAGRSTVARLRLSLGLVPVVFVTAILVAAPFLLRFDAPVNRQAVLPEWIAALPVLSTIGRYVGVVWWDHAEIPEFLRMWGVQALILVLALVVHSRLPARRFPIVLALTTLALLPLSVLLGFPLLLLVPIIMSCAYNAWCLPSIPLRWAFGLSAVGWGLVLLPEVIYLRDAFENRMNTAFKLYFQAWQILGVASAVFVVVPPLRFGVRLREGCIVPSAAPLIAAALLVSLAYPYAGVRQHARGTIQGLDATAFLADREPGAAAAVEWLRRRSRADDVVLEATGRQYSMYARLSTYAGRPTVLGWAGHEGQWRAGQPEAMAEVARRHEDVLRLYGDASDAEKRRLLERYGVRYAYYGSQERAMQAEAGQVVEDSFRDMLRPVLDGTGWTLYAVDPA